MISTLSYFVKKLSTPIGFIVFLTIYSVSFYLYFFSALPFSIRNVIQYNPDRNAVSKSFFYSPETAYEAFNKSGIPDLQYFNSNKDIYNTLEKYGHDGRRTYERILLADIIYPTIYGFFFSILLTLILRKAFPDRSDSWQWNILPFGATLFDYIENAVIIQIVIAFPGKLRSVGSLPGYFTLIKHIFLISTVLMIIIGTIVIIYKAIKGERTQAIAD